MPSNQAQLVVYFPGSVTGGGGPFIAVNGKRRCDLVMNTFTSLNVTPGKTEIVADARMAVDARLGLKTKANHRYYIKVSQNQAKMQAASGFGLIGLLAYNTAQSGTESAGDWYINPVPIEAAQRDLIDMKQALACE